MKISETESTDARTEDGSIRTSDEASVMGAERRDRVVPIGSRTNFERRMSPWHQ